MFTGNYIKQHYGQNRFVILYDGECPVCNHYVTYSRFNDLGKTALVDARQIPEDALARILEEYDLDKGMIFWMDGQIYYGFEAAHQIARLSTAGSVPSRVVRRFLSEKAAAKAFYPLFSAGRRALLFILGRSRIARGRHFH